MAATDLNAEVLRWFGRRDTGTSSKTIALWISQRVHDDMWGASTPSDPADLGRCLRLLRDIPELRARFGEMSGCSRRWANMLTYWNEIEQSMIDEVGIDWEKARSAPKTYALMKEREKAFDNAR